MNKCKSNINDETKTTNDYEIVTHLSLPIHHLNEEDAAQLYLASLSRSLTLLYKRMQQRIENESFEMNAGISESCLLNTYLNENQEKDDNWKEDIINSLILCDILGCLTNDERFSILDQGYFNSTLLGYMLLAVESLDVSAEKKKSARCSTILDSYNAREAAKHYLESFQ